MRDQTPLIRSKDRWSPEIEDALVGVLAASFADDPAFIYLLPDPESRRYWLSRFFRLVLRMSHAKGEIGYLTDGDAPAGVITMFSPGTYPPGGAPMLRLILPILLRSAPWKLPVHAIVNGLRYGSAMDKGHPEYPHRYVLDLAVDPRFQGRGHSRKLLEGCFSIAREERAPVYLETTNPKNIGLYERFGFRVAGETRVKKDAPPLWYMIRPGDI